jgi:uncharacterized oxidoreductase
MEQPEMTKIFSADYLRNVGVTLFQACGASQEEASIVAEELVNASLMGLESHGVTRYIWYTEQALAGKIKPGSPIRIVKETANTAVIDCGSNFGPVSARQMADIVAKKALDANIACVVSQHSHHIARLGSYVARIAEHGLFAFMTVNAPKSGQYVVPWGGREGRLATNPLAYAAPTKGRPIVMDMSTSAISEGRIRVLMYEGKTIPPGRALDANGNLITDPNAFYGPPRGSILPLGGELGYKGFGLSLLVELLSGILAGNTSTEEHPYINGISMIAINPEAFFGLENFRDLADEMTHYMRGTPTAPGYDAVVIPGDLDYQSYDRRLVEGIPLSDQTWDLIVQAAASAGVTLNADQTA